MFYKPRTILVFKGDMQTNFGIFKLKITSIWLNSFIYITKYTYFNLTKKNQIFIINTK